MLVNMEMFLKTEKEYMLLFSEMRLIKINSKCLCQ